VAVSQGATLISKVIEGGPDEAHVTEPLLEPELPVPLLLLPDVEVPLVALPDVAPLVAPDEAVPLV
jgi:hypothetical protein